MTVLEMCERYYPRLWSRERLEALLTAGRITTEEFRSLTAEGTDHEA